MGKHKLSYVESLILEGDKQKQKDAKYNEMLDMLERVVKHELTPIVMRNQIKELIKESKEF